jgi:ATP-dependent Clp protease protease subunit
MPDHYVIFTAAIIPASANSFIELLLQQRVAGTTRLIIGMNCQGGNVASGMGIYNAIKAMPYEVVMHNIGNVDSIAVAIFMAGTQRYANSNTTFMFHSIGYDTTNMRLEARNLREYSDAVRAENKRIASLIAAQSTLSMTRATKLFVDQRTHDTTWGLKNGLISEVRDFAVPAGENAQLFS